MKPEFLSPCLTPFREDGSIDLAAAGRLLDHVVNGGVDGVVIFGSTGEFIGVPLAERKAYVEFVYGRLKGKCKILVGTGGLSAAECIEFSNWCFALGCDGVLVVSPFYYKLDEASLEAYYDRVASALNGPMYLYNIPPCTKHDVSPALARRLADRHPNIAGYKDSVVDISHTRRVIDAVVPAHPDFRVYSGQEENFAHVVMSGGCGAIGGISNVAPEVCAAWVRAVADMDYAETAAIQRRINLLVSMYDMPRHFVAVLKRAMNLRGIEMPEKCSFDTPALDETQSGYVADILRRAGLI